VEDEEGASSSVLRKELGQGGMVGATRRGAGMKKRLGPGSGKSVQSIVWASGVPPNQVGPVTSPKRESHSEVSIEDW
jgi:hypothetical protein